MKKLLFIVLLCVTAFIYLSGNPSNDKKMDTSLKRYDTLLLYSKKLPISQQELIHTWIKNDVIIRLRSEYYDRMTANSKP